MYPQVHSSIVYKRQVIKQTKFQLTYKWIKKKYIYNEIIRPYKTKSFYLQHEWTLRTLE